MREAALRATLAVVIASVIRGEETTRNRGPRVNEKRGKEGGKRLGKISRNVLSKKVSPLKRSLFETPIKPFNLPPLTFSSLRFEESAMLKRDLESSFRQHVLAYAKRIVVN